ncbi:MAG: polysulfide reductase [Streptosporangiales bacterium]|nr:polysulfide reductase [Streptosporangiales bacterium]
MTGERPMVPEGEFRSYYGRPIIKPPVWKSPDVPLYFFVGGLSGASAVMAGLAEATSRPRLARVGRWGAAAGALAGAGALIHDLGRPERFLNMLRVLKPTSPLSVGSWLLASFGSLAGAAAASDASGLVPRAGRAAGFGAAALGPAVSTYTAVLVADTAVPAWHDGRAFLPFVFAGSSAASAGGLCLLGVPPGECGPARRVAALGAALELGAGQAMERKLGTVGEVYREGKAGRFMTAARVLTAAGAAGTLVSGRSRALSALSGAALLAGSLCIRFGVFEAGYASARDPRHTVVSQRPFRS